MKIYLRCEKYDYMNPSVKNCKFLTSSEDPIDVCDVIRIGDNCYTVSAIFSDAEEKSAIVDPISLDLENDSECYEDDIVCPVCGHHNETCDLDWNSSETTCINCGAELEFEINYTFNTYVKEKPKVKIIK